MKKEIANVKSSSFSGSRKTQQDKKRFLELFRESTAITTIACQKSGVARATFYYWCANDPEFRRRVGEIKKEQVGVVEDRLLKAILEGNVPAIIFYLKSKHPDFKPKSDVNLDNEAIERSLDAIKKIIESS